MIFHESFAAMPNLPALITFLGDRFPRERTFVASVARNIRESGLIETGRPGRAGRKATLHDAAMLMIALASTPLALHAPERVPFIAGMRSYGAPEGQPDPELEFINASGGKSAMNFADLLTRLLESRQFDTGFISADKQRFYLIDSVRIRSVTDYGSEAQIVFSSRPSASSPDAYVITGSAPKPVSIDFAGPGIKGDFDDLMRKEIQDNNWSDERQMIGVTTEFNSIFLLALKRFLSTDQGEGRA